MPSAALAATAALVLAPTVALAALSAQPHPATPVKPEPHNTSGTAPPPPRSAAEAERWFAAAPSPPPADPPGRTTSWIWPLSPRPLVVRGFSLGPYRWSPGHRGVDLATRPGASLLAPAAGVVTFARTVVGRPILVITHADGVRTAYEPVEATVRSGASVEQGAVVGRLAAGPGHCAPATCVHWSARRADRYVDPLTLLTPPRIVLLPLSRASPAGGG